MLTLTSHFYFKTVKIGGNLITQAKLNFSFA